MISVSAVAPARCWKMVMKKKDMQLNYLNSRWSIVYLKQEIVINKQTSLRINNISFFFNLYKCV